MYVATQTRCPLLAAAPVQRPAAKRCGYRRRGMGASATQAVGTASSVASPVVTAATAGSVASILGVSTAVAVPVIGAAIAGITLGIEALLNSGCGQSCVITSDWANQAEALLKSNADAYFALSTPRSATNQAAALANFDKVWAALVQNCCPALTSYGGTVACTASPYSTAGKNCINDRMAGACKWKLTNQTVYPNGPAVGECFNWFNEYRDPIAKDPNVESSAVASAVDSVSSLSSSLGLPSWALLWAAVLGALLLAGNL